MMNSQHSFVFVFVTEAIHPLSGLRPLQKGIKFLPKLCHCISPNQVIESIGAKLFPTGFCFVSFSAMKAEMNVGEQVKFSALENR